MTKSDWPKQLDFKKYVAAKDSYDYYQKRPEKAIDADINSDDSFMYASIYSEYVADEWYQPYGLQNVTERIDNARTIGDTFTYWVLAFWGFSQICFESEQGFYNGSAYNGTRFPSQTSNLTVADDDWVKLSGMLRDATKGKGNFGVGNATIEEANALGFAWVGNEYKITNVGLISSDSLRQYRWPSFKPKLGIWQANLEYRLPNQNSRAWFGNAHINIGN